MVHDQVKSGSFLSRAAWRQSLQEHCDDRKLATFAEEARQSVLCEQVLLRQHGLALASELADLVESADGDVEDSSIATPMAVATWATHGCFNGTPIVEC